MQVGSFIAGGIVGMAMSTVQREEFRAWATIGDSTTGDPPLFAAAVSVLDRSMLARIRAADPSAPPSTTKAPSIARSAALNSNARETRFMNL
jgi:hypothetical protein